MLGYDKILNTLHGKDVKIKVTKKVVDLRDGREVKGATGTYQSNGDGKLIQIK